MLYGPMMTQPAKRKPAYKITVLQAQQLVETLISSSTHQTINLRIEGADFFSVKMSTCKCAPRCTRTLSAHTHIVLAEEAEIAQ